MSFSRAGGSLRSRLCVETLEDRLAPAVFTVTNDNDTGPKTLRWAVKRSNAVAGTDVIRFNIPGAGVHSINLASPLPALSGRVAIKGATQPGFAGIPLIELNGTGAGAEADGIVVNTGAGGSVIQGLVINRFAGDGIQLLTKNTAVVGCFIGTTVTGDATAGNGGNGVSIEGKACDNHIGGTSTAQRNVISGNNGYGVMILGATTKGNVLQGNFIGTNAAGTAAVGPGNVNGGVIIGTGSHDNTIGGTAASARNIISGNAQDGVTLFGAGTTGNRVVGNFIGTDVTGMAKLGNKSDGVFITVGANNNIIGGTKAGQGNVISGNTVTGVVMTGNGTSGNQLMGNFIGTDATGLTALGNIDGIHVAMAASGNVIGGAVAGAGNVISGNSGGAVLFADTGTTGNALLGNLIGTDATGAGALGNGYGVVIMTDAAENVVGGTAAGMGNVIAHNGRYGVYITTGSGNSVLGNRFFDNDGLGIDLWFTGVTANDANDTDSGGNSILNFPVLTSAVLDGTNLMISGTINTATNKSLRIEFFASPVADTSGFGEGQTFLGFVDVAMGANNTMNFSQTLAASGVTTGQVITATATDELGNTSEFSLALTVT